MRTFDCFTSATPVLIDGGMSTQLEAMGHQLRDPLWTARALLSRPADVTAVHRAYVDAGARVVITASYQVSRQGFIASGFTAAEADAALVSSVQAAKAGVTGSDALVAASVGPYGAITADGAEYRGNYGLSLQQLIDFHAERLEVLATALPDLFAVETIPDALEAQALAQALPRGIPSWVSFTAGDGAHIRAGQRIEDAVAIVAEHPAVRAVGVNCTEPQFVPELITRIRSVTNLAIVVYPNAGGTWDAERGVWVGATQSVDDMVRSWVDAGANIIGGCCGTNASAIAAMGEALTALA